VKTPPGGAPDRPQCSVRVQTLDVTDITGMVARSSLPVDGSTIMASERDDCRRGLDGKAGHIRRDVAQLGAE
jgi:hypothetical protein